MTKHSDQNIKKATLFISALKLINQTMLFFWAIYLTQLGLSGIEQGMLLAIYPFISLLLIIPAGLLNDRIYPKTLIFWGYLFLASQFLIMPYAQNFVSVACAFILGSIGTMSVKISVDSFFYKTGEKNKSKQIGSYVGGYLLAAGIGVLIGGFMLEAIDFKDWFTFIGISALLLSFSSLALPKTDVFHVEFNHYKQDIKRPEILAFIAIIFLWASHMGAEVISYGLYLKEDLLLNYNQMGLFIGIAIILMYLWANLASDLIGKNHKILHLLYIGLLASGIGQLILTSQQIQSAFFGRMIHEAGDAFMFVFLYHSMRQLFPKERSGGNAGLIHFIQSSSVVIASLCFGPLGKTYGNTYPLIISAGIILLAIPVAIRFSHLIKH
jgi:MFS family permease